MSGSRGQALPVATLAALLLVAAALGWLLVRTLQLGAADERAVEAALTVDPAAPAAVLVAGPGESRAGQALARSAVTRLLSYDGRTFDADVAAALRRLAPEERAGYAEAMGELRDDAVRDRVSVRASVVGEAVLVATDDRVRSLLLVDLETSRDGLDEPRTERLRVLTTLRRDTDGWLVTGLAAR